MWNSCPKTSSHCPVEIDANAGPMGIVVTAVDAIATMARIGEEISFLHMELTITTYDSG